VRTREIQNLGGGTVLFKNAIPVPQKRIITLIDELSEESLNRQYEYVEDENGKIVHAINKSGFIYQLDSIAKNPIRIQNLIDPFFWECENVIYKCLLEYIELFPAVLQCLWWKSEGHVLKYQTGSSLGFHCDNDVNYRYGQMPPFEHATRNVVSALVYINSNCDDSDCDEYSFTGGCMEIPYSGITIKPKSGDVLLMPANYLGAHEIMQVTSGSRYSYLSWFAQGSPDIQKGISPEYPTTYEDRELGGQWWMTSIIEDYDNYLMEKYGDEGKIPKGAMPFKSRQSDHK
jgi:hypothetical protein